MQRDSPNISCEIRLNPIPKGWCLVAREVLPGDYVSFRLGADSKGLAPNVTPQLEFGATRCSLLV